MIFLPPHCLDLYSARTQPVAIVPVESVIHHFDKQHEIRILRIMFRVYKKQNVMKINCHSQFSVRLFINLLT